MKHSRKHESGAAVGIIITIILLGLAFVGAVAFGGWTHIQYTDLSEDFEGKKELAVSEAVKIQADQDAKKLAETLKEPNLQFVGPDDYGRVTFEYPKDWSVYEATDVTKRGGKYEAYLSPIVVPTVDRDQKYAIRVVIEEKSIDKVLTGYERDVSDGKLKTSSFSASGITGTRIDGNFTDTIRGSAVVFKIRDKTLTVRTDSSVFNKDYEKLIKTIKFNQ